MITKLIPKEIENKWQKEWEEHGINAWDPDIARDETFIIDTPPPTVSGQLHMGHIFGYVQTDFIARFQRMRGKNVFYPIGFDDNGLPTERYVEKVMDIRAMHMESSNFIKLCQEISQKAESEFRTLFRAIALSVDWSQEYRTISDRSRFMSQLSFLDLYHKGHIKRYLAPVFWDVVDKTAIAQTEIEDREKEGMMYDITFCVQDSNIELCVSTTRPELIPACVALLYHPDDQRYNSLKNAKVITPVFQNIVQIIADTDVEMAKGTGLVMCCTFGDIQDLQWQKRHNLPIIQCISPLGYMQNAGVLNGLKISHAREKILTILGNSGALKTQKKIMHSVKCAERSGAPLELIATEQWYILVMDKKNALIQKAQECVWYPNYMRIRLENWINGLNQEWCISRQRYSGVQFPVWYSKRKGEEGSIIVAKQHQLPVDPLIDLPEGYTREEVEAETDVMDTWATSAISPQLSSLGIADGYMLDPQRHKKLFPCDLRPQGHDIIRTWAFCTIVKTMLHENTIPWKNVMINGWCMANDRSKMSKSKGNVVHPSNLLHEKGADVVRYWASTATLGTDIVFSEEKFQVGKRLINKLWNAARFCQTHIAMLNVCNEIQQFCKCCGNNDISYVLYAHNLQGRYSILHQIHILSNKVLHPTDLWLLHKLKTVTKKVTEFLENFDYYQARNRVETFFWNDFCDNYVELVKGRLYKGDADTHNNDVMGDTHDAHDIEYNEYENSVIDVRKNSNYQNHSYDSEYNTMSARYTLYCCFNVVLKLFAPFIPHVTEEIYHNLYGKIYVELDKIIDRCNYSKNLSQNIINSKKPSSDHNETFSTKNNLCAYSIHSKGNWPNIEYFKTVDDVYNIRIEKSAVLVVKILELIRRAKSENSMPLNQEIMELVFYTSENIEHPMLQDLQYAACARKIIVNKIENFDPERVRKALKCNDTECSSLECDSIIVKPNDSIKSNGSNTTSYNTVISSDSIMICIKFYNS